MPWRRHRSRSRTDGKRLYSLFTIHLSYGGRMQLQMATHVFIHGLQWLNVPLTSPRSHLFDKKQLNARRRAAT